MKSCHEIDPLFTPFVDGQLERDERAEVEAHLAACPPCRDRADAEHTVHAVVRSRAEALSGRAPGSLLARCASIVGPRVSPAPLAELRAALVGQGAMRRWVPLSLAATMLLGIGGVFMSGMNNRADAAFAAQLALDHTRCFELSKATPGSLAPRQAEARFREEYGLQVSVPASTPDPEIELQDVRRCEYAHGEMAHVLYRREGRPLSLFVVPDTRRRERSLEIMGHDAVIWTGQDRTYVLMGQEGQAEMLKVVGLMRQVEF